jgi:hypothetical protein
VQGKAHPSVILDLEARVSIAPHSARARVLLLLQSPDRNQVLSNGKATINGRETKVEVLSSAGQMGYAGGTHGFDPKSYWAGMIPHENEWTWLICEVPPGQSQVRFNVRAAPPRVKIGLWVWSERDCAAGQIAIPLPCSRPEMPQYQDQLEREGMCLLRPERRE